MTQQYTANLNLSDYFNTSATSITLNNDLWTTATNSVTVGELNPSGRIQLKGANADVDINGKSLKEFMQQVEERLAILQPNPELEKEWEELKALGDQYRQMEQDIKDKMKTWDILNKP